MHRFLWLVLFFPAAATAAPPAVTAVAYHPEGKAVAFGTSGEVRLFDTVKGEPLASAAVPGRVTAIAFDPKGDWLAAAGGEAAKSGVVFLFRLTPEGRCDATPLVTITG